MRKDKLQLFAVRNASGQYFHRQAKWGGATWGEGLERATIYTTLGRARQVVSMIDQDRPGGDTPVVVTLDVSLGEIVDETARLEAKRRLKEALKARRDKEKALRDLENARARLRELEAAI